MGEEVDGNTVLAQALKVQVTFSTQLQPKHFFYLDTRMQNIALQKSQSVCVNFNLMSLLTVKTMF